jgi:hypothetical protein
MQPPLKRLSTGTGQQEGQRMQDVDENFGRVEQAIDTLNANASLSKGILPSCDLDSVRGNGVYYLLGTNSYANMPSGITYGILDVKTPIVNGLQTAQRIISSTKSLERMGTSSGFGQWREC